MRIDAEYVVPLRTRRGTDLRDLADYLGDLVETVDVTVVDGSDPDEVERHRHLVDPRVRVLPPRARPGRNGKVRGVVTGVEAARHECVVLADDDVRYEWATLRRVVALLHDADVVRPQNHFVPLPWHARWDTARTLVNRALGADYPGTLAVRRDALLATGGYDGDVLFENLELIRTIRAAGGRERRAPDVFVARRPPDARHFWGQRVRQAYDSRAQPLRYLVELALLPVLGAAVCRGCSGGIRGIAGPLLRAALAAVLVGEIGRRRAAGRSVFPATSALWTPIWIGERAVCAWATLIVGLLGGPRYSDGRLARAATSPSRLRHTLEGRLDGPR